jgi:penicillin-binding protein 1A
MLRNGFISDEEYRLAKDEPIRLTENLPNPYETVPYFTETVRQYIVEKYGEERLYNDGLQVWTTCDPPLQQKASEALLEGARAWERRQNRPVGLLRRLKADELRSFLQAASGISHKPGDIIQAVVLQNHTPKKRDKKKETSPLQDCTLALQGDYRFRMELESSIPYRPNDLLEFRVTSVDGDKLVLEHESLPPIQGALVCIENRTGYVRALVGGLDFERSRFNRAVQAKRQPGSAFKPVVYAAALEWSHYGPYTVIVDEPIAVLIDPRDEPWIPLNSDGRFHGPMNLREALVHSRNTVSVKLMMDVGIDAAIEMAHNLGIQSPLGKHLSISLGASEVSPLELTTAYSVFPNMGTRVQPVLVKKVADRFGRILEDNESAPLEITRQSLTDQYARAWLKERATWAPAPYEAQVPPREAPPGSAEGTPGSGDGIGKSPWPGTEASSFSGLDAVLSSRGYTRPEPRRVLSPQTSYLMLSMLRETCVSGTAAAASRLRRRDLAGKTGTTDDCTDAWFIGFNPRYTTGVWMGYDAKVSLGRKEYGAAAALPVWMSFMKDIPLTKSSEGYPPPPGIVFSAWAGSQPPRNTGLDTLLESGPVLAQEFAAKQASPVDVPDGPGADPMHEAFGPYAWANPHAGMNPLAGVPGFGLPGYGPYSQPVYAGYSPDYYPGMIRILSPTGETLGHAPYSVNDRGKIVVYRDSMVPMPQVRQPPAEPDRSPSDRQALQQAPQQPEPLRSFLPRAAQILQHLQQFLPRGFYFEWGR